jgi:hypothetical protein
LEQSLIEQSEYLPAMWPQGAGTDAPESLSIFLRRSVCGPDILTVSGAKLRLNETFVL